MLVKEVLKIKGNTLYTVAPDTHLSDAVISMADHDIGSVVVIQGGKLAGMLTFREVIAMLAKRQKEGRVGPTPPIAEFKVSEAMQRDPVTTNPEMDVDDLRSIMLKHHARYVPVMEGGMLLGVISFHDVAKAVLEEKNFENKMLKAYIKDWPEPEQT
jgi:CBS domain-containing protein